MTKRKSWRSGFLAFAICWLAPPQVFATAEIVTYRVPEVFPTIQAAIDAAFNGVCVVVADGVYSGNGFQEIDLRGRAITVRSENGPENCILTVTSEDRLSFHLHQYESPTTTIQGFTIVNGAGIYVKDSSATIRDCIIRNNFKSHGGGIYFEDSDSALINCVVADNTSGSAGGGINVNSNCDVLILNCTIVNNQALNDSGGGIKAHGDMSRPVIWNCIIRDNQWGGLQSSIATASSALPTVGYSNIEGPLQSNFIKFGENLDVDPRFVDPANGDYRLSGESPVINRGDPDAPFIDNDYDIEGQPRVQEDRVDLGPYERIQDCNGNGIPDREDLLSASPDCNQNEIPDECDVVPPLTFWHASPEFAPLGQGLFWTHVVPSPPPANGLVTISVSGAGDLGRDNKYVDVLLNDQELRRFLRNASSCGHQADTDEIILFAEEYNRMIGHRDATFQINCSDGIDVNQCDASFVQIRISYAVGDSDCNGNGVPDTCDVRALTSKDCDRNGRPDECLRPEQDCNHNGQPDQCDIALGESEDCDQNGIPDECELSSAPFHITTESLGPLDFENPVFFEIEPFSNTINDTLEMTVAAIADLNSNAETIDVLFNGFDIGQVFREDANQCPLTPDIDQLVISAPDFNALANVGIPNIIHLAPRIDVQAFCEESFAQLTLDYVPRETDCNGNGAYDSCDIANLESLDADGNWIPDECQNQILVPQDYPTIQQALDAATDNTVVTVSDGIYTGEENKNLDFAGKSIWLRSKNGPHSVTIDCEGDGRAFDFDNQEPTTAGVEGFTLTGGSLNRGAGMRCKDESNPTILRCIFEYNSAKGLGGGLHCNESKGQLIANCVFRNNVADEGGAISLLESAGVNIRNCTIVDNAAIVNGGAIRFESSNRTDIRNCILWGNSAPSNPQVSLLAWPNDSDPAMYYCDVENGVPEGVNNSRGNISEDPLLRAGDYHISRMSPCRNAGDPYEEVFHGERDIDLQTRVVAGRIDIGADERQEPQSVNHEVEH